MIGTEALGKMLTTPRLVEHAADADALDVRRFNTESDDPPREDIHDDHHPETLQQDGLASKQVDAPEAVAGFSNEGEPRRTFAPPGFWESVARCAEVTRVSHPNPTGRGPRYAASGPSFENGSEPVTDVSIEAIRQ